MGPTVWTAAFQTQVYSSLWWGHTRTLVRTRSGHICVSFVSKQYFSRRNRCLARELHHLLSPHCNVKLEFSRPLWLSKTVHTHTHLHTHMHKHTHTNTQTHTYTPKPWACWVGVVYYQQFKAWSVVYLHAGKQHPPCGCTPGARHILEFSVYLKGAKQITLSNESDNSFINKHACSEYTLACFTHHHTSQKSYKDYLYTVPYGTDGIRKGRENGTYLTHPVSMCPVNKREDSCSWLLPLLSQS